MAQDYINDLKNEKIIGEITNTYNYMLAPKSPLTYTPYNLIFGENSVFCEWLKNSKSITDEWIINAFSKGHNFDPFKDYISKGIVLYNSEEITNTSNPIRLKIDYKEINKVTLIPFEVTEGIKKHPLANCTMIHFDEGGLVANMLMPALADLKFLFDQKLSEKVTELLEKTSLAEKIISQ